MQIKMISVTFGKRIRVAHFWVYQWGFETEGSQVLSSHIAEVGLLCPVTSVQKKTLTGWFMSLMLLESGQLLSIWEKLQRPSDSIKGHIFVYCMGTCVVCVHH